MPPAVRRTVQHLPRGFVLDDHLLTDNIPALLADRYADAADRVARSGYRDPVARALRTFVRSDGEGGASYADPNAKAVEVDAKTATARFLITSKSEDRHGDVVEPHGCEGRLERYAKNPVVFFGHKSYGLPVGRAVDKDGNWAGLEFTEAGVISPVKFHLKTKESEDVFALVDAGELSAASIGFIPLRAKVSRSKVDEDDDLPKGEMKFEPYVRYRFLEWELLEWSVVAVPANPDCVHMRLSKGIGGKPLSEKVARYLEPFAAPARVWSLGASLGEPGQAGGAVRKERGRKAVAGSVKALEAKVDALTALVGEVAFSVHETASCVSRLSIAPKSADLPAPEPTPAQAMTPPAPKAAAADPALGQMLASLKRVGEAVEANAAALRRVTGRVD